jgi:PKD repeat protein
LIKLFDGLDDTTPTTFADLRTEVDDYWDRGLLGLVLDPNFPSTPYVYVLYTVDAGPGQAAPVWRDACPTPPGPTTDGCVVTGRLARLTAAGDAMVPGSEKELAYGWCQQFPSHSVGDLEFGADGYLYVSGGDGASFTGSDYGQLGGTYGDDRAPKNPCQDPEMEGGALRSLSLHRAAGPTLLNGTILRVDPATGDAAPGNPLGQRSDLVARKIVAEGLRNPFRFAIRPGTNDLWIGDVGWNTWEEINRRPVQTAAPTDFGWPCWEGSAHQKAYDSVHPPICASLYSAGTASTPYYAYEHSATVASGDGCPPGSSSITGVAFYPGGSYPARYDGALFFADYTRNCIWAMLKGSNGLPDPTKVELLVNPAPGPVDLQIGPNGDLFYPSLNDGTIHRIRYFAANRPPVASATASPTEGEAPLTVNFDGSGSSDPDPPDTITYSWDLNGDGTFGDSIAVKPVRTYSSAGNYNVRLRVTDSEGLSTTSSPIQISAGNTAPVPVIETPLPSLLWKVGDPIEFKGHAMDKQDGTEPASRLTWTWFIHHCPDGCHVHPLQGFDGVASGSLSPPDHDYPSFLELRLTATDANGVSATTSVELQPETVDLTFDAEPTGMSLTAGATTAAAPLTATFIVGSTVSVSAPDQSLDGTEYFFSAWSDGGAQSHELTAPESDSAYTATFVEKSDPPTARIAPGRLSGKVPFTPELDGGQSADPDGDSLTYSWDLNGDGRFGDSHARRPSRTYHRAKRVRVQLEVSDGRGGTARASAIVIAQRNAPFHASIESIPAGLRASMIGSSWHSGCPVPLSRLRLLQVAIHRFDGSASEGRMVVRGREAENVVTVMRKLYAAGYPIHRMELVDAFGGDEELSQAADNTSAFNCDQASGADRAQRLRSRGLAIDLNPVENPYVDGSTVSPANGQAYADRTRRHPAVIRAGHAVVRAFESVGWSWGGSSTPVKGFGVFFAHK